MIAHTIQLALAPVFVLVAIGNIMNILSTRLGRIVDRSRYLLERHAQTQGADHDDVVREIRMLDRRIATIGRAILSLVLSGLTVGLVVAMLFLDRMMAFDLQPATAAAFILAIVLLMYALLLFLRETRMASASLRIPHTFLEWEREL
ncbi:hypothetical protein MB02_14590 [Croceicoccus estronivorus]|uniref:DUF2721 domain-containing protein n=1 Tax=Croceicoccus estronivorus TaxID=1172626 RepID=UPI000835215F|nr:DUF2721 domain-containing protein [Croceicoccus estronivorus]OCC22985.1 hypothetical protein MB02_14590 [Croceicoccus estronivorus]